MVKIQKISEIEPRLGFTEFDMLKKYRQSFATSELGRLHARHYKINCVTHYFFSKNSSVGERPAPRGGTTCPDERKITII